MQTLNFKDFKSTVTELKKDEIIREEISGLEYLIYNKTFRKLLSYKDIVELSDVDLDLYGLKVIKKFSSTDKIFGMKINPFRLKFNNLNTVQYYTNLDLEASYDNIPIMVFSKSLLDGKRFGAKNIWHVKYQNMEVVEFLKEKFIEEDSLELNNIMIASEL